MTSSSRWAPLFRRVGSGGAGLRSRGECRFSNSRVFEKYTSPLSLRRYTTQQGQTNPKPRRTGLYIFGATIVAATVAVSISDEARYVYIAAQRTGRVVSTLALNINEYAAPSDSYAAMTKGHADWDYPDTAEY